MDSAERLEQRAQAGQWLSPGEVGKLFGKSRSTAINWMKAGKIGYRQSPSGYRECDPQDVLRELGAYRQVRGSEQSES